MPPNTDRGDQTNALKRPSWKQCPNVSTIPLRQWGFWQCLPFSWTTRRGKHCRHPIAVMGVVDIYVRAETDNCAKSKIIMVYSSHLGQESWNLYYAVRNYKSAVVCFQFLFNFPGLQMMATVHFHLTLEMPLILCAYQLLPDSKLTQVN